MLDAVEEVEIALPRCCETVDIHTGLADSGPLTALSVPINLLMSPRNLTRITQRHESCIVSDWENHHFGGLYGSLASCGAFVWIGIGPVYLSHWLCRMFLPLYGIFCIKNAWWISLLQTVFRQPCHNFLNHSFIPQYCDWEKKLTLQVDAWFGHRSQLCLPFYLLVIISTILTWECFPESRLAVLVSFEREPNKRKWVEVGCVRDNKEWHVKIFWVLFAFLLNHCSGF